MESLQTEKSRHEAATNDEERQKASKEIE